MCVSVGYCNFCAFYPVYDMSPYQFLLMKMEYVILNLLESSFRLEASASLGVYIEPFKKRQMSRHLAISLGTKT